MKLLTEQSTLSFQLLSLWVSVDGILSVYIYIYIYIWLTCIHAGVIPIIRCPRGNAAEMIATKLDSKLRDHAMNSRANLFSNSSSNLQRPGTDHRHIDNTRTSILTFNSIVLILLDRNMDLTPMLSHSWTYQSLIHDVLEMKLNRIIIEVCHNSSRLGIRVY